MEGDLGIYTHECINLGICQENKIPLNRSSLPQGLVVFIERSALEGLHDFLAHDVTREHGGVLVGQSFYDPEEKHYFSVIRTAIPAYESEGSSVHLQFTPDTWAFISGIIEESYPEYVVLGWYHSHPGLGVFMSGTDRGTQSAFYSHEWNMAVVVDPIVKKTGWFSGKKCTPLNPENVIPYQIPEGEQQIPFEEETGLQNNQYLRRLGWLLPFLGMVTIAGILGLWILNRSKNLKT